MITNLVGTRIRSIRRQRKLTQQQLADLAGIPRATLATVEKDDANPSLGVVFKIACALEMTLDQLVDASRRFIRVIPGSQMHRIASADEGYQAVLVTPPNILHVTQWAFMLRPGAVYMGKPHLPGSEEYLLVQEGEVELDVGGEKALLQAGDTACFHGNAQHSYRNPAVAGVARGVMTILATRAEEKVID
ncbi:MAG: helix-turn-helix domain-containing protein [Magnetococcales bacterium]|nr:helix-turn-helix domain-containing protein [Magnetococcales bacterium]NGZ05065.1 helix-turn-helix domain-containing protein [Magnetococcales bacterium]